MVPPRNSMLSWLLGEELEYIYGSRSLKDRVAAREVLIIDSDGVEKNVDSMLCHRFKGKWVRWSRAGVQNQLKLRILRYDRGDWKTYWRRRSNETYQMVVMRDRKYLCPKRDGILLREACHYLTTE